MRKTRIGRTRLVLTLAAVAALTSIFAGGASGAELPQKAAIDTPNRTVSYANRVLVSGNFPGAESARIVISHRAAGEKRFHRVRRDRTGPHGHWKAKVRPRRTGFWRAELVHRQLITAPDAPADDPATTDTTADPVVSEPIWVDQRSDPRRIVVRSQTDARLTTNHVIVGGSALVTGRVVPGGARRLVTVIANGDRLKAWTDRSGRFELRWRPPATGHYRLRVRAASNLAARGSGDRAGRLTAYRQAGASWYGPGFYGNHTSCGQILTPGTIGVAHKYLPCGTKLQLRYGSRTINVRVIDTGPFVPGREFDLTEAVKNRLGFPDVGTVLTSR